MSHQLDLFDGALAPIGAGQPRPADPHLTYQPEYLQVAPGAWTVVVYALIPKNGCSHLNFPHHWGTPADAPRWRVARHGELPGETFLFDSRDHARQVVTAVFGPEPGGMYRHLTRIEIPSDDHRQYAGRRAHRRHPIPTSTKGAP